MGETTDTTQETPAWKGDVSDIFRSVMESKTIESFDQIKGLINKELVALVELFGDDKIRAQAEKVFYTRALNKARKANLVPRPSS